MLFVATLCDCTRIKAQEVEQHEFLDYAEAVDLSEVLGIYEKYGASVRVDEEGSFDFESEDKIFTDAWYMDEGEFFCRDTSFAIQLPQYNDSKHPFLSSAEVFYNACIFDFNVCSDFENFIRIYGDDPARDMQGKSPDCIRDPELRSAAQQFRDSLVLMLMQNPDRSSWTEEAFDMAAQARDNYGRKIDLKAESFKFYTNREAFIDSLEALNAECDSAVQPQIHQYEQMTDTHEKVKYMLHALNDCKTFDEQCFLLLNWFDRGGYELSRMDNFETRWVLAVADTLLCAGKYNPFLSVVWDTWRCLHALHYYGYSRQSDRPNNFYNERRKCCYLACLRRIEKHPNDRFAINCAELLAGKENL